MIASYGVTQNDVYQYLYSISQVFPDFLRYTREHVSKKLRSTVGQASIDDQGVFRELLIVLI